MFKEFEEFGSDSDRGVQEDFYTIGNFHTETFEKAVDELLSDEEKDRLLCYQSETLTTDENMKVNQDMQFSCGFGCGPNDEDSCEFVFISYVAPVENPYGGALPTPLLVKRKENFLTFEPYQPWDSSEKKRADAAAFACASYSLAAFAIFV